ncbi:hypothetical protein DRO35_01425 [Candidatus Bathyarchaeota archaeon]|nr:MAG: hypothetical protein DRO35_01425 [Candidatus Bathyarchaeota archaeon]
MIKRRNIWRELEVGFGGGSKFRILLHLALHHKEAHTKYSLVRATGLRTPTVGEYLRTLVKLGWVKEYPFTPRTYQINIDHIVVKCFIDFLEKIKNIKGLATQ